MNSFLIIFCIFCVFFSVCVPGPVHPVLVFFVLSFSCSFLSSLLYQNTCVLLVLVENGVRQRQPLPLSPVNRVRRAKFPLQWRQLCRQRVKIALVASSLRPQVPLTVSRARRVKKTTEMVLQFVCCAQRVSFREL